MDFGPMPISNGFLTSDQCESEYFFNMSVGVCTVCATFQLLEVPAPQQMFHEEYAYFASTSKFMTEHFRLMAENLSDRFLKGSDPFIIEIGSNDGITLKNFADANYRHLGIDPSDNVAETARKKGVSVWTRFFNEDTAKEIAAEQGQADLIITTNTMHNIEDINSVVAGVKVLLKPTGVMVQEDPYLGAMIENTTYDLVYAEHMYIWSITSLNNAFGRQGFEIFDVEPNDVHGGCMRYFICHQGAYKKTDRLRQHMIRENQQGLAKPETYEAFRKRCELSRTKLVMLLCELKEKGKIVAGYGATAKSTTIMNYCGISEDLISYIADTTPAKQNKLTPGMHIPVVEPSVFSSPYPDYAVLFAWNHFDEIEAKETEFRKLGGKWIIPVKMVDIT
jgi:methylation protein EvaC